LAAKKFWKTFLEKLYGLKTLTPGIYRLHGQIWISNPLPGFWDIWKEAPDLVFRSGAFSFVKLFLPEGVGEKYC